ncbi:MAG TPA: Smr/MutS family protein [Pyrinomonadaceae bacterium]|nr:Smr/MutS family protein [Pyrinomonadaceae bacterium]
MHDQAFSILDYNELLALVRRSAQTPMGRARVTDLKPLADISSLQKDLEAVAEAVALRKRGVVWSFGELEDPSERVALLRVEGAGLEPLAILSLAKICEQAMSARGSILAERDASPTLWQLVAQVPTDLNRLIAHVSNKIQPNGELDDRASTELARIRHEIGVLRSRIARTLENIMRRSGEAIQDEIVTLRNDRFVIPVKSDHRARVSGVAHGYSSSGATAFVEPLETIDANNELQALHEEEAREIARILFALSEELRANLPAIEAAIAAVSELDFINAKAIFHQRFNCVIPQIESGPQVNIAAELKLVDARHPLLEENLRPSGASVVPVSFSLDDKNNAMVISGANAGGKTVVLKTAGLLSLMALSGLPVPAGEAHFPFYTSVLADIGDHQSLAANLSTFTSHVANISRMIELCEAPALVLLDEVGTGTDPEEGSALGVAVVDHFRKVCRAQVLATTHYSGLKMYAANEAGVLNASVEFDEKTLRPTYRLLVGLAGSSSGLEIAKRFGVPREVIDVALDVVNDSTRQAAEYLRRIKRESEEAQALRLALEEERAAVAEKFASLDRNAQQRERERESVFHEKLATTVKAFEERSRELVAAIADRSERLKVEREAQRRAAELKREIAQANQPARNADTKVSATPLGPVRVVREGRVLETAGTERPDQYVASAAEISVGDKVKLKLFGSVGIVDSIKGEDVEVRVKSVRMREKLQNLERVELSPAAKSKTGKFSNLKDTKGTEVHLKQTSENGRTELNVIGRTTDEAVAAVDKFLDEAALASLQQVRIIHGHGTGALRRVITEMLKDHPHVARVLPAPQDQGGSGATLVELKQ